MGNKESFIRTYNYEACLATGKLWTLVEAAEYVAAHLANKENWSSRKETFSRLVEIRGRLLMSVKQDIDEGRLVVNEVYPENSDDLSGTRNYDLDVEKTFIQPLAFINWAISCDVELPEAFARYHAREKSNKPAYYEGLGLKRSTIHHERCRAVAELIWSIEPEIPIAEMARRKEIIQCGCEGQEYDMRTVSRWLANLKADRHPGQPRKKPAPIVETEKN